MSENPNLQSPEIPPRDPHQPPPGPEPQLPQPSHPEAPPLTPGPDIPATPDPGAPMPSPNPGTPPVVAGTTGS